MADNALAQENMGPKLLTITWVFAAIAVGVVSARYYVRIRMIRKTGLDDWLILLTLCFALVNSVFCTISVSWGLGRHVQFLSSEQITYAMKFVYLCEVFSIMSPGFGRISYAFLLLELVPPSKWRRRFLWTIITIQFVVDVGTVIISYSQCQPMAGFWDQSISANCWSPVVQVYTGYFQGSVCSMVDLVLALFPASLFWNLNMKLSSKISLSVLMGLGSVSMIAAIMKTIELRAIGEKGDPTYAMSFLAIWWTLEVYLVLLAVTIPTLKPIITSKSPVRCKNSAQINSLLTTRFSRPGKYNNKDETSLVQLDALRSLDCSNGEISTLHETVVYHPESLSLANEDIQEGVIRKETQMSISYARTANLEKGSTCRSWLPV